jgi:hypothetical protein
MPADTSIPQGSSPLHGDASKPYPCAQQANPQAALGASITATAAPAWTGTHPMHSSGVQTPGAHKTASTKPRSTWP